MNELRVNPNRMELLRLRRRREVAVRGHKLLKDKLDELVKELIARVEGVDRMRREAERSLARAYGLAGRARGEGGSRLFSEAMAASEKCVLEVREQVVMNVRLPAFEMASREREARFAVLGTPAVFDAAHGAFVQVGAALVELAAAEKAVELLAAEVEATRRRVNALEYVLVPRLDGAIRSIAARLDETERAERVRLMKVKSMGER